MHVQTVDGLCQQILFNMFKAALRRVWQARLQEFGLVRRYEIEDGGGVICDHNLTVKLYSFILIDFSYIIGNYYFNNDWYHYLLYIFFIHTHIYT